jgi:hypothetical protein
MIWTAWNNGSHSDSGAGYGFKVPARDRDKVFRREWPSVVIELPTVNGYLEAEVNIAKDSFWNRSCRELINKTLGQWLRQAKLAPWHPHVPPKFEVEVIARARFRVKGVFNER